MLQPPPLPLGSSSSTEAHKALSQLTGWETLPGELLRAAQRCSRLVSALH